MVYKLVNVGITSLFLLAPLRSAIAYDVEFSLGFHLMKAKSVLHQSRNPPQVAVVKQGSKRRDDVD